MGGPIGSEHPIHVVAAGDDGSWVIVCQARVDTDGDGKTAVGTSKFEWDGDTLTPYLVLGSGMGIARPGGAETEAMLVSPGQRFIAFAYELGLAVLDTKKATLRRLPPLARNEPAVLAFSADDRHLVGRFESDEGAALQVFGMVDDRHWTVELGGGEVGALWFDAGADYAWVEVTRDDTNGDGRVVAPRFPSTLRHPCGNPVFTSRRAHASPDTPVAHRIPLVPDAAAVEDPGGWMFLPSMRIACSSPDSRRPVRSCAG